MGLNIMQMTAFVGNSTCGWQSRLLGAGVTSFILPRVVQPIHISSDPHILTALGKAMSLLEGSAYSMFTYTAMW